MRPRDTALLRISPNDPRFDNALTPHPAFRRCPVIDCHRGQDAQVYTATLRGPDGRQRTVFACVTHIIDRAEAALSGVRVEPFE